MEHDDKPFLRTSMRLPVTMRGTISDGHKTTPCLVQDMSARGMLMVCVDAFEEGQILDLLCAKPQGTLFACKVQVCHRDAEAVGVKIIEIVSQSPAGFQFQVYEAEAA